MLTFGTGVDPVVGSTLDAKERDASPSGRHLGSLADLYFVEWVNLQTAGGGLARFDPMYLSSHGHAWNQLETSVYGLDLTDGVGPGFLVNLPFHAWTAMHYRPIWSARPSLALDLPVRDMGSSYRFEARGGLPVDGPLFLPPSMMDREPATVKGVNPVRRELSQALEINGQYRLDSDSWDGFVALDYAEHDHRYPTLLSVEDGSLLRDDARSLQALVGAAGDVAGQAVESFVALEWSERSHDGAQFRLPEWLTHQKDELGVLTALKIPGQFANGTKWSWAFGAGYKQTTRDGRNDGVIVSDIENEWMWQARPKTADDVRQLKFSTRFESELPRFEDLPAWVGPMEVSLSGSHIGIDTQTELADTIVAQTYERGQSVWGEAVGVSLIHYQGDSHIRESVLHGRLESKVRFDFGELWLDGVAALDASRGAAGAGKLIGHIGDAAGLAMNWQATDDTRIWLLVRREPLRIAHSALSFANTARPSGLRSEWLDDGDGIPTLDEAGAVINSTGGAYHRVDDDLARPMDQTFAIGTQIKSLGAYDFTISGTAHWLLNRYTVRYAPEGEPSYTPTTVADPGGDGLGETKVEGGGQLLTAYNRNPGGEGEELYMLTNASRADLFLGFALEFKMHRDSWWFVDFAGAAYMSMGSAPFGMFPDRNDPGIVHESSADPNARLSKRGRYDPCRAFAAHLYMGFVPLEDLELVSIIRYRDGQPMTRYLIADLAQGPTPLMAVARGEPMPRHTFHMTWDVRVAYELMIAQTQLKVSLDIYNLLGSSTEILEYNLTGDEFRRSLEMVPNRAVSLALELTW